MENIRQKGTHHPKKEHLRLYSVWSTMKARCQNPNSTSYQIYGGRGIKVCDDWMQFDSFCEWAFENGYDENAPSGKCTLDRIDVDGNYEPLNCRWVDRTAQSNNRTSNRYVAVSGETDTLANWSRRLGLKYGTVRQRIHRGYSPERALRPVPTSYAEMWERRKRGAK